MNSSILRASAIWRALGVGEAERPEAQAVAEEGAELVLERLGVLVGEGRPYGRGLLAHLRLARLDHDGQVLDARLGHAQEVEARLGIGLAAARETKVGDDREYVGLVALEEQAWPPRSSRRGGPWGGRACAGACRSPPPSPPR